MFEIFDQEKQGLKTIIAGPRNYFNYETLLKAIECVSWDIIEVVSGDAKGVDQLGIQWAIENNIPYKKFPADWDKYGKAAGMMRNKQMGNYANALIALWADTRGTKNMIEIATWKGLKTFVYKI